MIYTVLFLKIAALVVGVWAVALLFRKSSAGVRHWVWATALVGVPVLAVLELGSDFRLWRPDVTASVLTSERVGASAAEEGLVAGLLPETVESPQQTILPATSVSFGEKSEPFVTREVNFVAPMLWVLGSGVVLGWFVLGRVLFALRVRRKGATRFGQGEAYVTAAVEGPVVYGVLRSRIFLPTRALEWDERQTALVLRHEQAHVERRDLLWQTVGQAVCAAFWWHPGVWFMASRMRSEAELACDESVVASYPESRTTYAELLLAHTSCGRSATMAMARRSGLKGRILAVLSPRKKTNKGRAWAIGAVLSASILVAVAYGQSKPRGEQVYANGAELTFVNLAGEFENGVIAWDEHGSVLDEAVSFHKDMWKDAQTPRLIQVGYDFRTGFLEEKLTQGVGARRLEIRDGDRVIKSIESLARSSQTISSTPVDAGEAKSLTVRIGTAKGHWEKLDSVVLDIPETKGPSSGNGEEWEKASVLVSTSEVPEMRWFDGQAWQLHSFKARDMERAVRIVMVRNDGTRIPLQGHPVAERLRRFPHSLDKGHPGNTVLGMREIEIQQLRKPYEYKEITFPVDPLPTGVDNRFVRMTFDRTVWRLSDVGVVLRSEMNLSRQTLYPVPDKNVERLERVRSEKYSQGFKITVDSGYLDGVKSAAQPQPLITAVQVLSGEKAVLKHRYDVLSQKGAVIDVMPLDSYPGFHAKVRLGLSTGHWKEVGRVKWSDMTRNLKSSGGSHVVFMGDATTINTASANPLEQGTVLYEVPRELTRGKLIVAQLLFEDGKSVVMPIQGRSQFASFTTFDHEFIWAGKGGPMKTAGIKEIVFEASPITWVEFPEVPVK